ncbi:unnamed protein product [Linum tenue]|uniref:Rho GTPase-activating protein 2 n=1 Tax=Linum tenue TaxID=586396 RepID=A0AAV0MNJ0_9ROSI|nr:unnamed protein product [Linum tenue]
MSGRLNSNNFQKDTNPEREERCRASQLRNPFPSSLSLSVFFFFFFLRFSSPKERHSIDIMTGLVMVTKGGGCGGGVGGSGCKGSARGSNKASSEEEQNQQLSTVAVLLSALRKSLASSCRIEDGEDLMSSSSSSAAVRHMDIGWPTNVQHITHVTFDRFNGFLGLPMEFEVEIPSKVPSASVSVFGVSAESMQCCYDSKGNSVPTILLLMQQRLYKQDGLKAEGIFRINPENGKEEHVRDQLNRGIVPDDIDVHCLAGLIKAWFRELPSGVLDGLSPEQVLQCNTEEDSVELVTQLKPTEAALLDWAVDLMTDVVQEEEHNKMNARNIAMVFAPNMTQMSDPLTALMHAVQVMNLLKTLITKNLREREEAGSGGCSPMSSQSYGQHTNEGCDSQQDTDISNDVDDDDDDDGHYSHDSENSDDREVESLSKIEELFLNALDEDMVATDMLQEQPSDDEFSRKSFSKRSCSSLNMESGLTFTDAKNDDDSASGSSDGENSKASLNAIVDERSLSRGREYCDDVKMEEKVGQLIMPVI